MYKVISLAPTNQLLAMITIPVAIAISLQIIKEFDPTYSAFSIIHPQLPSLMARAIFNRWLNFTNLMVPLLVINMFFFFVHEKKNWVALIGFILAIQLAQNHNINEDTLMELAIMFLLIGFFAYFFYRKFKAKIYELLVLLKREPFIILNIVSTTYLLYICFLLTTQAFVERKVLGKDAIDPLVAMAKKDGGLLLLGSYIVGTSGFNPQLRTERPIIVPSLLNVYDAAMKKTISVYCFSESLTLLELYNQVQPCFEHRSVHEWEVIKKETQATGMITLAHWKLSIPAAITAGGFSYYKFQNTLNAKNK